MKHPTPLPSPRRVALLLLVRAALAFALPSIADATELPRPVVAQLAALAGKALDALASPEASDDTPAPAGPLTGASSAPPPSPAGGTTARVPRAVPRRRRRRTSRRRKGNRRRRGR